MRYQDMYNHDTREARGLEVDRARAECKCTQVLKAAQFGADSGRERDCEGWHVDQPQAQPSHRPNRRNSSRTHCRPTLSPSDSAFSFSFPLLLRVAEEPKERRPGGEDEEERPICGGGDEDDPEATDDA